MEIISAVYKIMNEVTGDSYIGSSKDVKRRWVEHKSPSVWKRRSNSLMYKDMQKYGVEKFRCQILTPVNPEYLKQVEQELIELLKPTYNDRNAKGLDAERQKEAEKKYNKSEKGREVRKKYSQSDRGREVRIKAQKKYKQSDRGKEVDIKAHKKYNSQLCEYNGETLTLSALLSRFRKMNIPHATIEAKKYLKKDK